MRTFCLRSCFSDDTFKPELGEFLVRKLLLKVCQYVWVCHSRSIIVFKLSTLSLFKTWMRVWKFECVIVCPILKVCLLEFEDVLKVFMPLCLSNEFVWRFVLQMSMWLSVSIWRYECKCLSLKVCLYVCHFCPCA